MTLVRRYGPFLLLAAAQLFIILVVPSREPTRVTGGSQQEALPVDGSTGTTTPGSTDSTRPGSTATTLGTGSTVPGGGPTTTLATTKTTLASDTRHCVNGLQYGDLREGGVPPCTPKFTGANGGAPGQGVSANTVEVVYYRSRDNPVVKQILQTEDLYSSPQQEIDFARAATTFINAHYELYGRRVKVDYVDGQCLVTPPDFACLRKEAHQIAQQYHPFAAFWDQNTVVPDWQDQLSLDGVVNAGGWHFDDSFNVAHRPYHYDVLMGGTFQAQIAGDYWCRRLAGHKAEYAGDPTGQLQQRIRKLAIVVQEYDLNVRTAKELKAIVDRCDPANPANVYTYSSDISTAQEQSIQTTRRIRDDGSTSIMFMGDPIAPAFGTAQARAQQYYPEYPLSGAGLIDYDILGRLYDPQQWAHAFGVSDLVEMHPFSDSDAARVYRLGGGQGLASHNANLHWGYFRLIAYGIQQAGPRLTPATFERALLYGPTSGGWNATHDPHLYYLRFAPGDYTAISDAREVYWDANAISEIDGRPGAYVPCSGGKRYAIGEWPTGEPTFPCR